MRDKTVSMSKGVAIILMVLAHTDFSDYGEKFIYMFHMPLFFFLSGYCFKDSYLTDFRSFAVKRVKGAYWTYVKWGIVFLILHNLFFRLNLYSVEYGDYLYGSRDFLTNTIYVIGSMTHADRLLGGFWFLHSYFVASFMLFLTVWIGRNRNRWLLSALGILLVVCMLVSGTGIHVPLYVNLKEFMAAIFMIAGYIYKRSELNLEKHPVIVVPVCVMLIALGVAFWPGDMTSVNYLKVVPYSITAVAGSLLVLSLCHGLSGLKICEHSLTYVGDRTLGILTWHFLSFKLVSLIIVSIYCLPLSRLGEFPVIVEYSNGGWWLPYTITGVTVPLLMDWLFSRIRVPDMLKTENLRKNRKKD